MTLKRSRFLVHLASAALLAACATLSPRASIKDRLIDLGLSAERATCLSEELDERLEREDLADVDRFLGALEDAEGPGGVFGALGKIGNPRAAAAVAASGFACAFGG